VRGLLAGVVLLIGLAGAFLVLVATTRIPAARVPLQQLVIDDARGVQIATIVTGRPEERLALNEIAPIAREAVVAAEDRRFYEHSGVDPVGVGRAVWRALRSGSVRQGGSTITQQYVKNVYVGNEASLRRKLREAALAVRLEQRLSKDEILERYLNTVYFGRGAYGIGPASDAYFGVSAADLSLAQAAYLAALIRGPESTDATRDPERARFRRSSVLTALRETGVISDAERVAAEAVPLVGEGGVLARTTPRGGVRYAAADAGVEFFVDYVRRELVNSYGANVVGRRGLRVRTTLDLRVQRSARDAAYAGALADPDAPSAAAVVLDSDGRVRAMVGGRSWAASQVNLAVGRGFGGRGRAAGSSFKPFALAAALEAGKTLDDTEEGPATAVFEGAGAGGGPWNVRNYGGKAYGTLTLRDATALSANTAFASLILDSGVGVSRVIDAASRAGIVSEIPKFPSLVLGTAAVSPLEMADAYLSFADGGERRSTSSILSVVDAAGKALTVDSPNRQRAFEPTVVAAVDEALQAVVSRGTGTAAARPGVTVAGKTGTTSSFRDAWFVGYTKGPCCVISVWVGYPEGDRAMTDVAGTGPVTGGGLPAKIFAKTLDAARAALAAEPAA
jgi:penicillin-binding protein 1A